MTEHNRCQNTHKGDRCVYPDGHDGWEHSDESGRNRWPMHLPFDHPKQPGWKPSTLKDDTEEVGTLDQKHCPTCWCTKAQVEAHPNTTIGGRHDGKPAMYGQIDVGALTGGSDA